ncbi:MAG TPA: hypothetical protein VGL61_18025 [Kofleriaceae bacterium]|nr:hypothetical protein [Kofleriaceae bacterium]
MFNRGSKDNPNWYVGYRENGRWVYKASRRPTKALAKRWVQEIESRIARGQVGIEESDDAPAFKPLFQSFLDGLTNRNADDDRSRGKRHLKAAVRAQAPGRDRGSRQSWNGSTISARPVS